MDTGHQNDDFLSAANATFIAEMQNRWRQNPKQVDEEWAAWFEELEKIEAGDGGHDGAYDDKPDLGWGGAPSKIIGLEVAEKIAPSNNAPNNVDAPNNIDVRAATLDSIRAIMLIRAYRVRGHLLAKLDPLKLAEEKHHSELDPQSYGFTENDMDRPIFINHVLGLEVATLREIIAILKDTYCNTVGVEFMHVQDPEQKAWIQERIEGDKNHTDFTERGKITIYERLVSAENFEQYLHKKYVGIKRFGLDGGESVIPALEQILKRGSQLGVSEFVIGMSHRGRLNVLHNVLAKPFRAIISEFLGHPANPEDAGGSGDVKYHMGNSADREFDGNDVHLTLNANPSHLEIVSPVVIGRTRAKQNQKNDASRDQIMGLIIHGDAAFAGQGIVGETFAFSALRGYRTGGTMHIIVNNQIGFTTDPAFSRSSPYPTDVAKMVAAPIFHVNCDDVEAVVHVARIATEFKQKFRSDVVVDLICYRRFGHNEGDEPAFTQPKMYNKIKTHPTVRKIYGEQLIAEGVLSAEGAEKIIAENVEYLDQEFEAGTSYKPNKADWLEGQWAGMEQSNGEDGEAITAMDAEVAKIIGETLTTLPDGLTIHSKLQRVISARKKAIESGENIDWATAEQMAFGSLLIDGMPVRLSGQDSCRGTFSQRHAVFVDQTSQDRYTPLNNIKGAEAKPFEVIDSPLSEASVLGFEYGFSQAEPNALVMWEAQFGDFANGAQVIVDQFIASGETKWLRMSGLVMLLPHGHEGQGPEHSSARMERYLQLCAEDNMQVVNCSTPANYFHALRRQVKRNFRKPLIVMTPKSLLRHKRCVSTMSDMIDEKTFKTVIDETGKNIKAERIVLCCGKVYYDLIQEREDRNIDNVAIVRVEQIYPFPHDELVKIFKKEKNAEIVWCQEEPQNMGAWNFVDRRIEAAMNEAGNKNLRPKYAGRPDAASPATGSMARHLKEQKQLIDDALNVGGNLNQ